MSFLRRASQNVLRFLTSTSDPSVAAGPALYAKDVAGVAQLFGRNTAGSVQQITPPSQLVLVRKGIFGDGYGGAMVVPAGTTTLTRDVFVETLTVQPSGILRTNGFRIFARTAVYNDGTIQCNGGNAAGTTGAAGAGAAIPTLGGGGDGANGGTNTGSSGAALTNTIPGYTASGGAGGNGTAAPGTGGAGGVGTPISSVYGSTRTSWLASQGIAVGAVGGVFWRNVYGGPGGGGGGGGGVGALGGGGGGGGGVLVICAQQVFNNGAITARGGTGASRTATAGAGGGGGGAGGVVILVVDNYYGLAADANGGAGGLPGAGGTAGATGTNGVVVGPLPG